MSNKAPRTCSICKEGMWSGFVFDGGCKYYCSEQCLNTDFTMAEWEEMYTDDGDNYWTQWEEADIEEDE